MNLYLKEIISPLELVECKKIIEKMNLIKNKFLKKWIRNVIKIIIRLNYEFFYLTGKIKIEEIKNNILCLIVIKDDKNNQKIVGKCLKNINKFLQQKKIKNVIVSEKLKKIDTINNSLENDKKTEGKYLLKIMIDDVIEYICNKKGERIESQTICILVNEFSKINLELIEILAYKAKNINIVTNNLKKFLIFANRFYEKNEIMITVSNNKRKTLSRSNLIVNIDFSEDNLKKYNINRTAIFINLLENQISISKGFYGMIVNGLQLQNNENKNIYVINDYKLFNQTILYESAFYYSNNFKNSREKIKQDGVKIQNLIGINGILQFPVTI